MADTVVRKGKATIRFKGLDALSKRLLAIHPAAQSAAIDVVNKTVAKVYEDSQAIVPVERSEGKIGGQLKSSGRKNKARVS